MPHWRGQSDSDPSESSAMAPDRLDRSQILVDCIRSLLELDVDRVTAAVLTNAPRQTFRDLSSHFATGAREVPVSVLPNVASFDGSRAEGRNPHAEDRRIVVIGWRPGLVRRHGFYLTWAHKPLFRRALRDPGLSHFIYLEDDIRFTKESFSYWCRFRDPLAPHGLLPGFVRYETLDDARYVVDQRKRQGVDRVDRRCVTLSQPNTGPTLDLRFVSLDNPYQGMYVVDRELAIDHLWSSPARSPLLSGVIKWPMRERAATGPIFDDVPPGFHSRNVVPIQTPRAGEYRLDPACLIEHLTGNYSRSDTAFGKILVEDMFLPGAGEPQLTGSASRQ